MALINIVQESDEEIIPSSCPFTIIGKPNEEIKLLQNHSSSVHSPGKEERIVTAHSYFNNSLRSPKRMKKKSFSFINEFSQEHAQSQEIEVFGSSPSLAPTKDNKKNIINSSSDTHCFEGESSRPANNSDSYIYVNNKNHFFNDGVNNSSSRFLSLSPLKKTYKMRVADRMLNTEASAVNLGNEVSDSPSEVFKKRKLKSVVSSSEEYSGEFHSAEILSQNKNSCIRNNVNAESTPSFSCDLFHSNLVTAGITEELNTIKGKMSPFKENKENLSKEIMVNNVEAFSSHQINSKKGRTLQILTNEIYGLINHPNSETTIVRESSSKKLESKKYNDARFSSEKCSAYDNPTIKQQKRKLKDVASNVHSSPENVNRFNNSPKKLWNKKGDDVSDGNTSPEKVNGFDNSLKKLRNKKGDDVSDGNTSPGFDNSPKKLRNKKGDDVSDGNTSPEKVNGFDNSPKKLGNKKGDDVSDGYTSPEKVNGFDNSLKKLRNKKGDDVSDGNTSPEKVNGFNNSPKKLRNKKGDDVSDGNTSPEKVNGFDNSPKKLRNKKGDDVSDGNTSPEKFNGFDNSPKKLQNKKKNDETSCDDHSNLEKVNGCDRSPIRALNKEHYNRTSGEGLSRPETVTEDDKPRKKQRKKKLEVVIANDDQLNPEIIDHSGLEKRDDNNNGVKKPCNVNLNDEISKEGDSSLEIGSNTENQIKNLRNPEMMSTSSTGYHDRPKIISETEYSAKKQRHGKLVNEILTDDPSTPDKVPKTDHALREQSDKRSIGHDSSPEILNEFESRTKKQRNSEQLGKTSTDRHSSPDNKINENNSALKEQWDTMSNTRSVCQDSSTDVVSEFGGKTKKQSNSELVERTSTDHHSSLDNKVNGHVNATKKQRRSNDDQTRTDRGEGIISWDSENEMNDFRLIILKEDIPLTAKEIYYLHKKLARAYTLSEELYTKLRNLNIKVTWKLSELHRDYNFIHNGEFSYADKSDLRPTKLKEGAFEPEENEAIMDRWKLFCKLYNFNESKDFRGFLPKSYDHKKPNTLSKHEKLKFVQFLGKHLPDRLLHAIYARFIELFKYYHKGRFSTEEDELLLIFKKYSRNKRIYSILASLLHRSRYSVYRRMMILNNFYGDLETFKDTSTNNNSKNKNIGDTSTNNNRKNKNIGDTSRNNNSDNKIDPHEENELKVSPCSSSSRCYDNEALRETIVHLTGSDDIQKWDSFTGNINCWRRIGKKCKLPPVEAKLKYLCDLRIKSLRHKIPPTSCLQMKIIHRLKKYKWKKWKSINWNLLSAELFHLGPVFLYVTFRRYVKNNVPSEFWRKLADCLNYIEQNVNNNNTNLQNEDISKN